MRRIILLFILLVGIAGTACADYVAPVDTTKAVKMAKKAKKLLAKGKEAEAIDLYEKAGGQGLVSAQDFLSHYFLDKGMINNAYYWIERCAKSGMVDAQELMIYAHMNGSNAQGQTMFPVDYEKAAEWCKKATAKGSVYAAEQLGLLYEQGLGVPQSYANAHINYMIAAEANDPLALYRMGYIYREGLYGPKNEEKAFKYFKKAADLGYEEAWFYVAYAYHVGAGTPQDYDQAIYWYTKAIETSNPEEVSMAKNNLAALKETLSGQGSDNESVRMYRQGAELGQDVSQCNLGNCYFRGEGVAQDYGQAIYWYTKAAEQGYAPAQTHLGVMYRDGIGTTPNTTLAKQWLTKAAEQNDTTAMCALAFFYDQQGDNASAFGWVKKAAELDCLTAIASLPYYYNSGMGTSVDHSLAFKYAKQAADRLHIQGFRHLSDCYLNGWGTPKNLKRAITAALKGYDPNDEEHRQYEEHVGLIFMEDEDYKDALEWFKKAETPLADYSIGWIYGSGVLGSPDMKKAKPYIEKAARQTENVEVRQHARQLLENF